MSVKIIPFQPIYAEHFRDLNLAWLEKYFYVEPKDKKLLENCKKSILDKGGFIFLAEYMGEIVGCFSFIPYNNNQYELGKMAVDPNHQGLGIGQQLLSFAIDFAKQQNWNGILITHENPNFYNRLFASNGVKIINRSYGYA